MLDAIKGLAGGGKAQKQAEELEALIAAAREERRALDATVKAVTGQSAKLTETGRSLEQVNAKAVAATGSLDAVAKRIEKLEQTARAVVDIEKKAQGLDATISMAHAKTEKLVAPDGDLDRHRLKIEELMAEAADAHVAAVHGDLEQLRRIAGQLGQDYEKLRGTSRDAREDSSAAVEAVKEVENKLGRLAQLQELSKETEAKLTTLNALAEHVNQKTRALDGQKHIVDRAVVEANRVNELVWNVDVQIGKLNEGLKQGARAEEAAARMQDLGEEVHDRVAAATRVRDEFMHDSARMEKDGRALVGLLRTNVEMRWRSRNSRRSARGSARCRRPYRNPSSGWRRSVRRSGTCRSSRSGSMSSARRSKRSWDRLMSCLKRFSNRPCTTWGGRGTSARTDAGGPMRAYSMDRRERALLDSDAGMKAAEVAAKYRVSGSWVRLLKQRRRDTGEVAPRVQRHGRRCMLEPHLHTLAALIAAQPDRTLAELKDALATPASVPTVWRAVRALGLTVKKHGPPVRTRSA